MTTKLDAEDRETIQEYKDELAIYCEQCGGKIGFKQKAVQNLDGEWSHVKCALDYCHYACKKCGLMIDADSAETYENTCSECDGELEPISKSKALKLLHRETPAEADPDLYDIE